MKSIAKLSSLVVFTLTTNVAMSATPKPGQIAHHQATRLSVRRLPFTQEGQVQIAGKNYTTKLSWFGRGTYDFVIENLPSGMTSVAGVSGFWKLQRRAGNCSLQVGRRFVSCGQMTFWPMFEFSGTPEQVGPALYKAGLFAREDLELVQSNSKEPISYAEKRVSPVVAQNGNKPMAALEIRAPDAEQTVGPIPKIQFEQNFLAPIYAQFFLNGAMYEIRAKSNYKITRDQPRYSHVIAENISVIRGEEFLAVFKRKKIDFNRKLKPTKFNEGVLDISSFKNSLNSDGEKLAAALLVTH